MIILEKTRGKVKFSQNLHKLLFRDLYGTCEVRQGIAIKNCFEHLWREGFWYEMLVAMPCHIPEGSSRTRHHIYMTIGYYGVLEII